MADEAKEVPLQDKESAYAVMSGSPQHQQPEQRHQTAQQPEQQHQQPKQQPKQQPEQQHQQPKQQHQQPKQQPKQQPEQHQQQPEQRQQQPEQQPAQQQQQQPEQQHHHHYQVLRGIGERSRLHTHVGVRPMVDPPTPPTRRKTHNMGQSPIAKKETGSVREYQTPHLLRAHTCPEMEGEGEPQQSREQPSEQQPTTTTQDDSAESATETAAPDRGDSRDSVDGTGATATEGDGSSTPIGARHPTNPDPVPVWPQDAYFEDIDDIYETIEDAVADSPGALVPPHATTATAADAALTQTPHSVQEAIDWNLVLKRPKESSTSGRRMSLLIDDSSRASDSTAPPVPTRPPSVLHSAAALAGGGAQTLIPIPEPLIQQGIPCATPQSSAVCSEFSIQYLRSSHLETAGTVYYKTPQTLIWKKKYCVVDDKSIALFDSVQRDRAVIHQTLGQQTHVRRLGLHERRHQFAVHGLGFSIIFGVDSTQEVEAWVSAIEASIKRGKQPTAAAFKGKIQGWAIKCKHGFRRRRWVALVGCVIFYSKAPDRPPLGRITLMGADMHTFDPDAVSDPEDNESCPLEFVLQITNERAVYHLIFASKAERDRWAFYCGNVVGVPFAGIGTPLERNVRTFSSCPDTASTPFWKTDERFTSTYPLPSPLTTLPSSDMEVSALSLWRDIQLFASTQQEGPAIAYHLKLAQQLMAEVVKRPELHDELLCQLVKATNTAEAPSSWREHQAWQLLALAAPIQPPAKIVYSFLRSYLEDTISGKGSDDVSINYAQYVHRAVLRAIFMGGRTDPPSLLEVESAICRHPANFAFPMSVTVFLSNDNHYLAGFDASSTFFELTADTCKALGLRPPAESGFALYMNDPTAPGDPAVHCTRNCQKVCDALHEWERLFSTAKCGLVSAACPTISLRKRFWMDEGVASAPVVEQVLTCYEVAGRIGANAFPLSPADCARVLGHLAQIEFGAVESDEQRRTAVRVLQERFFPTEDFSGFLNEAGRTASHLEVDDMILETWRSAEGRESGALARAILEIAAQWRYMPATVLPAELHPSHITPDPQPVWLAIDRSGVHVLSSRFEDMESVPYTALKSFGSSGEEFRLIYRPPARHKLAPTTTASDGHKSGVSRLQLKGNAVLLFTMPQMVEATLTIAGYINAIVSQEGVTCAEAGISQLVWDAAAIF